MNFYSTRDRKVFTVSRLNQDVQRLLETNFGTLWLGGELSNFSRPASGHFYFTLKDSQAQIRCAMFKGRNRYIDFEPKNGEAVIVRGKLGLYSARGDFQLICEHMEPAGEGKLQAAFEATKKKLFTAGWFDTSQKKPLPPMPQSIGVVTSPTGAALRDVLQVLGRRYAQAKVIVYPTLTQGAQAAPAIVRALQTANQRKEVDVLLLVRGGGSLEDLWAFNEETVAGALRESQLPVIAGIGHEIDITISDLVADVRAPTPSAAAELTAPDTSGLEKRVVNAKRQLRQAQTAYLKRRQERLRQQDTRLQLRHPQKSIRDQAQRVDELTLRVHRAVSTQIRQQHQRLETWHTRLLSNSPQNVVKQQWASLRDMDRRLGVAGSLSVNTARTRFALLSRALHNVSPLAVLERGYAVVKIDNSVVTNAASVSSGDEITALLANGEILAEVKGTRPGKSSVGKTETSNQRRAIRASKS